LNELALESERTARIRCAATAGPDFLRNSKQLAQEILDVRRERDDQLGLLLVRSATRIDAGVEKLHVQTEIGR
jgi:hypothetical protein